MAAAENTGEISEGRKRNLEALARHRWKPGQTGNQHGRPRKKPLTDALEKLMGQRVPKSATGILQPLRGMKWAEVMAMGLIASAAEGDAPAFREAADRVEGKVVTPVEVAATVDVGVAIVEAFKRVRGE